MEQIYDVEYKGHKYTSDGKSIFKDGKFFDDCASGEVIEQLEQVQVLKIKMDSRDVLYYQGKIYTSK